MVPVRLDFDDFLCWLASFGCDDIVGRPGLCFNSPLAAFLSCQYGYVVGEDGQKYGRAAVLAYHWRDLPRWGQLFSRLGERSFFGRSLSAYQALCLLIEVETALAPAPALVA